MVAATRYLDTADLPVTFVPADSLLAGTSTQIVTLKIGGSDLITVARRALVGIGMAVILFLTAFAVGT